MKIVLPDDINLLQAMMMQKQTQCRNYAAQVAGYDREIKRLKIQLIKIKRMLLGQNSQNLNKKLEKKIRETEKRLGEMEERLTNVKRDLESAAAVTGTSGVDEEQDTTAEKANSIRLSPRMALPATLPRETVRIEPAESSCPVCDSELVGLGETVSEQLDIINNSFRVIVTVRPKLACSICNVIIQEPLPANPLDRSYASPGLLARILVSKYVEHTPLYRQCESYARQGLPLSRNTLVRWVHAIAEKLSPLAEALNQYILSASKVQADYTTVSVQVPGSTTTRISKLWVYVRDERNVESLMPPAVWFAYYPDRKDAHPQRFLSEYLGVLQLDAYDGYNELYETERVTKTACLAHMRRKIHEEHASRPTTLTSEVLRRITELYAIEDDIGDCPVDQRLAMRKENSQPLMQSLYDCIQEEMKTLSVHTDMTKAFGEMLKQWDALSVFCSDGRVEIDNNIAENTLQGVALGRKNWLFADSDKGGEAAAIIYSLLGTCTLNGVQPENWLREVLGKVGDWPSNRVHELLPWNTSP
jgi:transposase